MSVMMVLDKWFKSEDPIEARKLSDEVRAALKNEHLEWQRAWKRLQDDDLAYTLKNAAHRAWLAGRESGRIEGARPAEWHDARRRKPMAGTTVLAECRMTSTGNTRVVPVYIDSRDSQWKLDSCGWDIDTPIQWTYMPVPPVMGHPQEERSE